MSSGEERDDQRIQRLLNLPVDYPERLRVMREGLRMAEESYAFDPAARETKNVRRKLRRAKHLEQYEAIMRGSAKHENATYNENYVWGAERFGINARFYLKTTAALMPRQGYNRARTINTSKDALGNAFRQITLPPAPTGPPYIAKHDLFTLIEHDNDAVLPPNQAQQHHLTWLIGFVCGVRPDAIGIVPGQPNRFLQWQDVEIARAGPRGSNNFKAVISFRWIKS
ncbi:hypothetical protein B9Z65_3133 [Elsinoe australis]|uniref:Uncharacterized protein n=1 Tax=Elsinoe australis TaxID=40998 RepID=A0A2P7ZUH5_9PEZI|nr:hypothetical protein B9Z65_3133 [Elsinoe australis]